MTPEVVNDLTDLVRQGGDLVIDAKNARALPKDVTGISLGSLATGCLSHLRSTGTTFDEQPYTYTVANCLTASPLLINEHAHPLITVNACGGGRVVVGTVDYWMTDALTYRAPEILNMEPPYAMLQGIRAVLASYFDSFSPVEIQPGGLGMTTCCYEGNPKRLLVGLMNHDLFADWQGSLRVRIGQAGAVQQLYPGDAAAVPALESLKIPAGDVLILDLRLR
jgi:hypothetical protein